MTWTTRTPTQPGWYWWRNRKNGLVMICLVSECRAVIEGLTAKVKRLTAWSDKMFGTPCEEIRHQQQVEQLGEQIEQQAKEIATLREALQLLYDCQNGCPLPKYEAEWNRAMALTRSIIEESV